MTITKISNDINVRTVLPEVFLCCLSCQGQWTRVYLKCSETDGYLRDAGLLSGKVVKRYSRHFDCTGLGLDAGSIPNSCTSA